MSVFVFRRLDANPSHLTKVMKFPTNEDILMMDDNLKETSSNGCQPASAMKRTTIIGVQKSSLPTVVKGYMTRSKTRLSSQVYMTRSKSRKRENCPSLCVGCGTGCTAAESSASFAGTDRSTTKFKPLNKGKPRKVARKSTSSSSSTPIASSTYHTNGNLTKSSQLVAADFEGIFLYVRSPEGHILLQSPIFFLSS